MEHTLLSTMVHEQPYPLLFATVSGAHLYGFPSTILITIYGVYICYRCVKSSG